MNINQIQIVQFIFQPNNIIKAYRFLDVDDDIYTDESYIYISYNSYIYRIMKFLEVTESLKQILQGRIRFENHVMFKKQET